MLDFVRKISPSPFKRTGQIARGAVQLRVFAAVAGLWVFALASGCAERCITDLDCDRTADGIEQVCSEASVCVEIAPAPDKTCGNNSQCDDGAIGGTGICWDGVCRFRPVCLLFDGPMHLASDCDGTFVDDGIVEAVSGIAGPCVSTLSGEGVDTPLQVRVDSLTEFSAEGPSGRVMNMRFGDVGQLCSDGSYYTYESVGRYGNCTNTGCATYFRPAHLPEFCATDDPNACATGFRCLNINTLDGVVGVCSPN